MKIASNSALAAASQVAELAKLIKDKGLSVAPIKMEGYLNIDSGTLNPFRHGEVFVLDDGMETDGQCSNVRIWGNTFHDVLVGISLAPIYPGPVYALRNRASGLARPLRELTILVTARGNAAPPRWNAAAKIVRIDIDPVEIATAPRKLDVGVVADAKVSVE